MKGKDKVDLARRVTKVTKAHLALEEIPTVVILLAAKENLSAEELGFPEAIGLIQEQELLDREAVKRLCRRLVNKWKTVIDKSNETVAQKETNGRGEDVDLKRLEIIASETGTGVEKETEL